MKEKNAGNKNLFTHFSKWHKRHKEDVLPVLTIILIVVTVFQIIFAVRLGNIEIYMAIQQEKYETLEQIALTENLVYELQLNNRSINILRSNLEELRTDSDRIVEPYSVLDRRLQQATDNEKIGTRELRQDMDLLLHYFTVIKNDVIKIQQATASGNIEVREERIDDAIDILNMIIENSAYDNFVTRLIAYKNEREQHLEELDKILEERIFYDIYF